MNILPSLTMFLTAIAVFAQTNGYEGNYGITHEMKDGSHFEYDLTLNTDGTFSFHAYEYHTKVLTPERHFYARGNWSAMKNLITFTTDSNIDLDEKYTLDFTNTKARIDRKSQRNKSPGIVKDVMRIYDSDIFWVKGKILTKDNP